jgi:hypothetical protein
MAKISVGYINTLYLSKVGDEIEVDGHTVIEIPNDWWVIYRQARKLEESILDKILQIK